MGRLDQLSVSDLHELLEQMEGNIPTQRVLAAISRKQGATIEELAERHNVAEKTIRNWLDRFAEKPVAEAPYDESRSGRPGKLTEEQKEQFFTDLRGSPEDAGYDRPSWFPKLAQHHLAKEYGVEYSLRHVYRLTKEAGVTYRTARPHHYKGDSEKAEKFSDMVQKN